MNANVLKMRVDEILSPVFGKAFNTKKLLIIGNQFPGLKIT